MCGGFTCSKNTLIALNILYMIVSFVLIGVTIYGRNASYVSNLPIISGILVCGVILFLISILGVIGAIKHHQVILFFYMVILFILFLIQFSIACACLSVNEEQQEELAKQGWNKVQTPVKVEVQEVFLCCGFDKNATTNADLQNSCFSIRDKCCPIGSDLNCHCPPCSYKLQNTINYAFKLCGSIGLFFSFTEFFGVWLTVRYRNQKDPRANPSAFL